MGRRLPPVSIQDEDLANAVPHQRLHGVEYDGEPCARLDREGTYGVHVVLGNAHVYRHGQHYLRIEPLGRHLCDAGTARNVLLEGEVFEVLLDAAGRHDGNVELARLTRQPELTPRELLQSELVRKCHDFSSAKMLHRMAYRIHRGGKGVGHASTVLFQFLELGERVLDFVAVVSKLKRLVEVCSRFRHVAK